MNETSSGESLMGTPIPSFDEKLEIEVWQMVLKYISKETRVDGALVYVVNKTSVRDLVIAIMEFYELQNKRLGKKKAV